MIDITPAAAEKLRAILEQRGPEARLRLLAGVLSGRSVRFTLALERQVLPADVSFEVGGLSVVADAESVPLVRGAVIDWVSQGGAGGFSIANPALDPAVLERYFSEGACRECG